MGKRQQWAGGRAGLSTAAAWQGCIVGHRLWLKNSDLQAAVAEVGVYTELAIFQSCKIPANSGLVQLCCRGLRWAEDDTCYHVVIRQSVTMLQQVLGSLCTERLCTGSRCVKSNHIPNL
jgi:hypothetical protein